MRCRQHGQTKSDSKKDAAGELANVKMIAFRVPGRSSIK
nr:hypothetical protein [Enterobacter hormaechei]